MHRTTQTALVFGKGEGWGAGVLASHLPGNRVGLWLGVERESRVCGLYNVSASETYLVEEVGVIFLRRARFNTGATLRAL